MAGTSTPGESSDNPVPLNITALIDIIFCLCIFFMCSFHFRQLEGKMESWLPRDRGVQATKIDKVQVEEIRIFVRFNKDAADTSTAVTRSVGPNAVTSDEQMRTVLNGMRENFKKLNVSDYPVVIDAEPLVPWKDVVNVLSICKEERFEKLQFAGPH
jgi:biopolymer transport protein ExbD